MNKQLLPIGLSLSLFALFSALTYVLVRWLGGLSTEFIWWQFALGIFIYLKTSVDYALFVGGLMGENEGIPKRIAMNVGTQVGCFLGVTMIVILWSFFKEIHWLMAILLVIAGYILIGLGDGSQEHFESLPEGFRKPLRIFFDITRPVVGLFTWFMPDGEMSAVPMTVGRLLLVSSIIPFALGADDLAGYMTLLQPANVFSLLVGIYFGDAIIDIALFFSPKTTVSIVKNRWVSYFGALFFIGLGVVSIFDGVMLIIK